MTLLQIIPGVGLPHYEGRDSLKDL
jgi:hypothetical protein